MKSNLHRSKFIQSSLQISSEVVILFNPADKRHAVPAGNAIHEMPYICKCKVVRKSHHINLWFTFPAPFRHVRNVYTRHAHEPPRVALHRLKQPSFDFPFSFAFCEIREFRMYGVKSIQHIIGIAVKFVFPPPFSHNFLQNRTNSILQFLLSHNRENGFLDIALYAILWPRLIHKIYNTYNNHCTYLWFSGLIIIQTVN